MRDAFRRFGADQAARRTARALRAARAGEADRIRHMLSTDPQLARATTGGNTVLEWLTQSDFAPPQPEIVDLLIDAGAGLDRALNLAGCWNLAEMCGQLLAAGADPQARADAGITPLESAAMHGSAAAVDVLIKHGLHRPSLWLAAAAGQLDLVKSWVRDHRSLRRNPGPYRPNWADVGRPPGDSPSGDPAEIIAEAFTFAALNGRCEVAEYFLDIGVDIDSRPYKSTTGLHFAIQFKQPEMVRTMLGLGASVTIRDEVFNADATGWAKACDDGTEVSAEIVRRIAAVKPR